MKIYLQTKINILVSDKFKYCDGKKYGMIPYYSNFELQDLIELLKFALPFYFYL